MTPGLDSLRKKRSLRKRFSHWLRTLPKKLVMLFGPSRHCCSHVITTAGWAQERALEEPPAEPVQIASLWANTQYLSHYQVLGGIFCNSRCLGKEYVEKAHVNIIWYYPDLDTLNCRWGIPLNFTESLCMASFASFMMQILDVLYIFGPNEIQWAHRQSTRIEKRETSSCCKHEAVL